jgi:dopamine beta-monooxygenase
MRRIELIAIVMAALACGADDGETAGSTAGSEAGSSGGSDPSATDPSGSPTSAPTTTTAAESTMGTESTVTDPSDTGGGSSESGNNEEIEVWELRADGFMPPLQETHYACFSFTFPTDQLYHIVGIVPQVTSPIVHHYVLSLADSEVMLDPNESCVEWPAHILWAWAPGIEAIELPPEAGFLVGHQGPTVTFILQVHYNNPLAMPLADDGGIDLHVTKKLRPNRAGIFTQGDILSIYIPGGNPAFEYVATCASEITSQLLTEPIHVFASFLHAHQIGSVLWTEVTRDGMSAGELARDDPFSFNTQNFQPVDFDVMPGDLLQTHCVYDSSDRQGATMGGEGSEDEMCINFMMYYPWVPAEACGVL